MAKKIGYGRNRNRATADRIVGWGKYRGELMSDVPTQYLEWFVRNAYPQMVARQAWAKEELERRKKADTSVTTAASPDPNTSTQVEKNA